MVVPRVRYSSGSPLARLEVVVLAGGRSAERAISLQSGEAVARALLSRGHRVRLVDPAEINLRKFAWQTVDVAFLALHGEFGEDGQVQELLDEFGVLYTGSDARTSRLAFSKSASKERFLQHDVPTPRYVVIHQSEDERTIQRQAEFVGYPLVVKPDRQGSSLGVTWVDGPAELADAVDHSFRFDPFAVIESAVVGAEWTVGILDELTLPPIRIETSRGFFDYQAKYEDESTGYQFESPDESPTAAAIVQVARKACEALGVSGLARVDLRVDERGRPWVLEVNTIPGMTSHSLVPKAAERAGLGLAGLCERALERCLERAAARRRSA